MERQIAWARRNKITVIDNPRTAREIGEFSGREYRTAYARTLNGNLFEPLSNEVTDEFKGGDGHELGEHMMALYSSSALACNLFHHLRTPGHSQILTKVIGVPSKQVHSIQFEQQRRVMEQPRSRGFQRNPNLDIIVRCGAGNHRETAIECKFIEPWRDKPSGLKPLYLETTELWVGLDSCKALAECIGTEEHDATHRHLHAAQLLKHLLGLIYENREGGKTSFELLYLWYDVPGAEGHVHQQEVAAFSEAVSDDGIKFRAMTCFSIG